MTVVQSQGTVEILSLSASETSVSRACVRPLQRALARNNLESHVTDIRSLPPVWSSNVKVPNLPNEYTHLCERVRKAIGVIFCVPVYCYTASGAAKTISEIIGGQGGALTQKPVAFLVASGTIRSHLAIRDLMSSMAFEQQSYCFPKHVSVQGDALGQDGEVTAEAEARIVEMAEGFAHFSSALRLTVGQLSHV